MLGDRLKEYRQRAGFSQVEVARKARITASYISRLEQNRVKSPSYIVVQRLASILNVSPSELLDQTEPRRVETYEELTERLRAILPISVPVYWDYPVHAGAPVEPVDYVALVKDRARGRKLEGYIVHGNCLEPGITDGNIIIIDRDGQIDNGDIVAALIEGELHLARLRKIADELYLENNNGRIKLERDAVAAPVIEVRRRLK